MENYVSISDFKGKTVLVDFWFKGCKPCIKNMRLFPQLLDKYKDELIIISYNKDSYEEMMSILANKPKPWEFLESTNQNWQIANVWETTDTTNLISELKLFGIHRIV